MNVGLMLQKPKCNLKNNPNEIYKTLKCVCPKGLFNTQYTVNMLPRVSHSNYCRIKAVPRHIPRGNGSTGRGGC